MIPNLLLLVRKSLLILPICVVTDVATAQSVQLNLLAPSEYQLAYATAALEPVVPTRGLLDLPKGQIGWFDYPFQISKSGWYRLVAEGAPELDKAEFIVDDKEAVGGAIVSILQPGLYQVGWIWMESGSHKLRIQQRFWTGMPKIAALKFEHDSLTNAGGFNLIEPDSASFQVGECAPLRVLVGGYERPAELALKFEGKFGAIHSTIAITASAKPELTFVPRPCDQKGEVMVEAILQQPSSKSLPQKLTYSVFASHRLKPYFSKGNLVKSIDATTVAPDYSSGATRVVQRSELTYRESDDAGSTLFVRHPHSAPPPSWFAYTVEGLVPGKAYILEIDYPDDQDRVFILSARDRKTANYTASLGVETGAVWTNSGREGLASLTFWPRDQSLRVLLINVHTGMRVACRTLRVFEAIEEVEPVDAVQQLSNRDFAIWNEEGNNFRATVGATWDSAETFDATDRYMRLVAASGASIFSPTAIVYNTQMYPSEFVSTFRRGQRDDLLPILLSARTYGLGVIPQLFPRGDELLWAAHSKIEAESLTALSRWGERHLLRRDGTIERPPFFNALDPRVQSWYVGLAEELAQRYSTVREMRGIDLRFSAWQNAGLNNLVSLDWGYDAESVSSFYRETATVVPQGLNLSTNRVEDAEARYNDLIGNHREEWVVWRCRKMTALFKEVVDRVRSVRSDLLIYVSFFALTYDRQPTVEQLREAGIDIEALKGLSGLVLLDARHQYGAREADISWRRRNIAELTSAAIPSLPTKYGRPFAVLPMQYIEIPGHVFPSAHVGLPSFSSDPFTSAASNPPGRQSLQRFAIALGETDAFMLGDGGNGFVFGDVDRAEFIKEFRSLPKLPFGLVKAQSEVVLRARPGMFYLVNESSRPKTVRLNLATTIVRRVTGERVKVNGNEVIIDLRPYDLKVYDIAAGIPTLEYAQ